MSIYKSGRPKRYRGKPDEQLPRLPGEYRIRDALGKVIYVGETCNIARRIYEHTRCGKFDLNKGHTLDYMLADGRSTSSTRRKHEQAKIDKYKPELNRSIGGEGRPAKKKRNS